MPFNDGNGWFDGGTSEDYTPTPKGTIWGDWLSFLQRPLYFLLSL